MKQLDFPVRIIIPHMRPLQNEHHGTKACNDADSCPTLRIGVHRIYLAASLDAQARSQVQTGLLPGLSPHLMAPCHLTHKSATWAKICVKNAKWRIYASNSR